MLRNYSHFSFLPSLFCPERRCLMVKNQAEEPELSQEELEAEEAAELPNREALSLVNPSPTPDSLGFGPQLGDSTDYSSLDGMQDKLNVGDHIINFNG